MLLYRRVVWPKKPPIQTARIAFAVFGEVKFLLGRICYRKEDMMRKPLMARGIALEEVLVSVKWLSTVDKVRLIKQVTTEIEHELKAPQPKPRKSLRGLWKGLNITEEDIAEARREMWGNFPREDF
jgi:hypothetical protein